MTTQAERLADWLAGTPTGGPAGDGRYPLIYADGNTYQVLCPAARALNPSLLEPALPTGGSVTLSTSVTDGDISHAPNGNAVFDFVMASLAGVGNTSTDSLAEGLVNKYYTDERAQDAVAAMLAAGSHTNITFTYDDAGNKISAAVAVPPSYSDEQAQDAIAAALAAGSHTGISFTYDDAGNKISATVTGGGGSGGSSTARIIIPLCDTAQSTKYFSSTKLALGRKYFDPNATTWGLSATSTATLYMLLETTNAANLAAGDLYRQSGTPAVVAAVVPTGSLVPVLLSVDVSAAFRPGAVAGIFAARAWLVTADGTQQATCSGAWIEVQP